MNQANELATRQKYKAAIDIAKRAIEFQLKNLNQQYRNQCPECKSEDLVSMGEYTGSDYISRITCENCNKQWVDVYTYTGCVDLDSE